MNKITIRFFILATLFILALIGFAWSMPLTPRAAALTNPCALDPSNLIHNGSMQASSPSAELADYWNKFILTSSPYGDPVFEHVDNEQIDPNGSQYIWSDFRPYGAGPFDAGIYQTVNSLTPGQYYHFWLGYALAAYDYNGSGNTRSNRIGRQVGVDPTGGTDPKSSNVIWSSVFYNGIAALNIPALNMTFLAQTTNATLYLRAINTNDYGRSKVWFDSVCMERWNPQPTPTFTPTHTPTPTTILPPVAVQNPIYLPMISMPFCFIPTVTAVDVGWHPKGVATDPATNRVMVSLFDESGVSFIDAKTNTTLATWWMGDWGGGNGIGVTNGRVVASLRDSDAVALIDATTGLPLTTKAVGSLPYGAAASNGRAWIANFGSGNVSVMDVASTVITTTSVGGTPSLVTASGNRGFVSYGTGVAEISNTGTVPHNFTGLGTQIFGVAFDATGNQLFVADRSNNHILVLDANSGTVLKSATLVRTPYALAFEPSQRLLYVVSADSNLVDVLTSATLGWLSSVAIGAQGTDGGDSIGVMNGRVYIANYDAGTISVIQNSCWH